MIKFLHTADVHLGLQFNTVSFTKEIASKRREELWTSFQRMVEYARENSMNFLLIAGDLFEDKYFTLGDMKRLRDILNEAPDLNVLISAGNHDYLGRNSLYRSLKWPSNISIFESDGIEKKIFEDLKTIVYGYSWDRVEIKENILFDDFNIEEDGYHKILLLHGDLRKESSYFPLDLNRLKSLKFDYIALGHIHKPEIFTERIAYCGSPEPLDFGEVGERGFIEGFIKDKKTSIRFIPFSKRRFFSYDIELNEDMGYLDIENKIKDVSEGNREVDFYRINLKGYIQNDIDLDKLITSMDEYFFHIEITNNTSPDFDLEELEKNYKDSIIGMFIREMKVKGLDKPEIKSSLYIGLDALLKGRMQ